MNLPLNAEQRTARDSVDGDHVVIAGPGSGKTAVLIERHLGMLTRGIPAHQILNLTFTNSAAAEMVERVGLLGANQVFRTFHSFALDLIKRESIHLPFRVSEEVLPCGQDFLLLKELLHTYPAITSFRSLKEKLSEWKCSNIEPEEAIELAYHNGPEFFYAAAYRDYEKKCREQGWLDFDSLMKETVKLLEANDEVRQRAQRKYISVDEAQDTDIVQFKLLQLIYGGNIFAVGDENQCQPPGTLVDTLVEPRRGQTKSRTERTPIEQLSETNDKLVSWDHHIKRTRLGVGRRFRRAVRRFDGYLLEIHSGGNKTRVTPNHFVWTKFNREKLKEHTHFVYLMWKRHLGFRVGTSTIRTACGANQISHRGYQEKADKMWILDIVESGSEARVREEIYSLQYQISERVFKSEVLSKDEIWRIFHSVSEKGGFDLLKNKGLLFDHPLVSWNKRRKKPLTKFHGYFKTVAANLLVNIMDLPTQQTYRSAPVNKIRKIEYRGPVYSLEVEGDHTYVADGIPVGNCIYEWRSAQAGNLTNFSQSFSGAKTLFLGQNYRSTQALVAFFKKILPVDNGIASHMVSERPQGTTPSITKYGDDYEEARVVLSRVADINNSAVIARTNRQLLNFQKQCMAKGIKSTLLGRKNLWQQSEVAHLLKLAKTKQDDKRPAHVVLSEIISQNNLTYIYRNSGSLMEKDPVENLNDMVKMSAKRGNTEEFLTWLRKLTYAQRSNAKNKEPVLTLTTVHQAKGREWKHVFVIGASQGLMPHKSGELLEEKRIFYVACTRAADTLDISFFGNRSQFLNDFQEEFRGTAIFTDPKGE